MAMIQVIIQKLVRRFGVLPRQGTKFARDLSWMSCQLRERPTFFYVENKRDGRVESYTVREGRNSGLGR